VPSAVVAVQPKLQLLPKTPSFSLFALNSGFTGVVGPV
jgi:hypothetical protein